MVLPQPKGLFLLGVQGCGKSLMAKSVADRWKLPLLRLDVASVLQAGAEEGLRDTIRVAESLAPVVLWIDELEKGFANSSDSVQQGLGTFLTWMQEKEKLCLSLPPRTRFGSCHQSSCVRDALMRSSLWICQTHMSAWRFWRYSLATQRKKSWAL